MASSDDALYNQSMDWETVFLKTLADFQKEGITGKNNETEIRLVQKWGKNRSLLMVNTRSVPPFTAEGWCGIVLSLDDIKKLATTLAAASSL